MKKKILIRLVVVSMVAILSLLLTQQRSALQNTDEQIVEEKPVMVGKRPSGEFIIWESITRYIMAGYH